MPTKDSQIISRLRSQIHEAFHRHGWRDEDDYALRLAQEIEKAAVQGPISDAVFAGLVSRTRTSFFVLNKVSKDDFSKNVFRELKSYLPHLLAEMQFGVSPVDLFPEVGETDSVDAELGRLPNLPERLIQDRLRSRLRERGATPIPTRRHDTAQEVADIEFFRMRIRDRASSFAVVVKGFRSVSAKNLTWESVAHQVTKAYRGRPDHIILASAKEPADGLLTHLQEYSNSVGQPELVVFIGPSDLLRILGIKGLS